MGEYILDPHHTFHGECNKHFLNETAIHDYPLSLEDAARIDGAGPIKYFLKILLPLSKSIIAGSAIINFVYSWNIYLWPLIVTMEDKMKTVQIGVKMLIDAESANNWESLWPVRW